MQHTLSLTHINWDTLTNCTIFIISLCSHPTNGKWTKSVEENINKFIYFSMCCPSSTWCRSFSIEILFFVFCSLCPLSTTQCGFISFYALDNAWERLIRLICIYVFNSEINGRICYLFEKLRKTSHSKLLHILLSFHRIFSYNWKTSHLLNNKRKSFYHSVPSFSPCCHIQHNCHQSRQQLRIDFI